MNKTVQSVADGELAEIDVMNVSGKARAVLRHEVYWPFGVEPCEPFAVTHLPSGYLVELALTRRKALSLVRRLRASGLNFSWTKPAGPSWDAVKVQMHNIVKGKRATKA